MLSGMSRRRDSQSSLNSIHNITVAVLKDKLGSSAGKSKEKSKRMNKVVSDSQSSSPMVNGNGMMSHAASMPVLALTCDNCLSHSQEIDRLKAQTISLKKELNGTRQALEACRKQETKLRSRLAEEARSKMQHSEKFENISVMDRPTALIHQYGTLYSQSRLDAMDALDSLPDLDLLDNLKTKLVFSVIALSFKKCRHQVERLKEKACFTVGIPKEKSASLTNEQISCMEAMENSVALYLRQSLAWYDLKPLIEDMQKSIYSTLYDYPCLAECSKLRIYIEDCVRVAWKLSVQNPPCKLEFDTRQFSASRHQRFHSSTGDSEYISNFIWPALIDSKTDACLYKGVVITS